MYLMQRPGLPVLAPEHAPDRPAPAVRWVGREAEVCRYQDRRGRLFASLATATELTYPCAMLI